MFSSPHTYGVLTWIPQRHFIFAAPLSLIVLAELLTQARKRATVLLAPAFVASCLCVGVFLDCYMKAQALPSVAADASEKLQEAVADIQKNRGVPAPFVIKYRPSTMGRSEFQFRVVPFLLLYDRELNAQGVWIEHEWAHYRYLPIAVNTEYQRRESPTWLYWDTTTFPDIHLSLYEESTTLSDVEVLRYINRMLAEGKPERVVSFVERRTTDIESRQHPLVIYNYAYALQWIGRLREALRWYTKAAEVDRGNYLLYYNRGLVHVDLGEKEAACSDFQRSLRLNPSYAPAKAALQSCGGDGGGS